jgi:hypothetical protein
MIKSASPSFSLAWTYTVPRSGGGAKTGARGGSGTTSSSEHKSLMGDLLPDKRLLFRAGAVPSTGGRSLAVERLECDQHRVRRRELADSLWQFLLLWLCALFALVLRCIVQVDFGPHLLFHTIVIVPDLSCTSTSRLGDLSRGRSTWGKLRFRVGGRRGDGRAKLTFFFAFTHTGLISGHVGARAGGLASAWLPYCT